MASTLKISDPWTWENARSKRSWSIFSCVLWNQSEHKTNKTSSFGLSSQHSVVHSFPLRTPATSNLSIWMQQLKFPYPVFPGRKHTALVELGPRHLNHLNQFNLLNHLNHIICFLLKRPSIPGSYGSLRNSVRYVQRTTETGKHITNRMTSGNGRSLMWNRLFGNGRIRLL